MATFQGKRVSTTWDRVLTGYVRVTHNPIKLNQGRRTMAEQQHFRDLYLAGKGPIAAVPSPNAPHIWAGRENHALDVDSWRNGENLLQSWLAKHGVVAVNNVPGEAWHLQTYDEAGLKALAKKLGPASKADRLRNELARIRAVVRSKYDGQWVKTPRRKRRAEAIRAWLKKHGRKS